jgi:hypothetical protein
MEEKSTADQEPYGWSTYMSKRETTFGIFSAKSLKCGCKLVTKAPRNPNTSMTDAETLNPFILSSVLRVFQGELLQATLLLRALV